MLRLNNTGESTKTTFSVNSNTTNVKVKQSKEKQWCQNFFIQIQPMLRLN